MFYCFSNPTTDDSLGVEWPVFDVEYQKFLIIGNELAVAEFPEKEELELWEQLHRQYLPKKL